MKRIFIGLSLGLILSSCSSKNNGQNNQPVVTDAIAGQDWCIGHSESSTGNPEISRIHFTRSTEPLKQYLSADTIQVSEDRNDLAIYPSFSNDAQHDWAEKTANKSYADMTVEVAPFDSTSGRWADFDKFPSLLKPQSQPSQQLNIGSEDSLDSTKSNNVAYPCSNFNPSIAKSAPNRLKAEYDLRKKEYYGALSSRYSFHYTSWPIQTASLTQEQMQDSDWCKIENTYQDKIEVDVVRFSKGGKVAKGAFEGKLDDTTMTKSHWSGTTVDEGASWKAQGNLAHLDQPYAKVDHAQFYQDAKGKLLVVFFYDNGIPYADPLYSCQDFKDGKVYKFTSLEWSPVSSTNPFGL